MTSAMKTTDRDLAYSVALALLLAISLAAFFCDPHWQPLGRPRISWAGTMVRSDGPAGGSSQ
jgi:hypothetical protein